MEKVNFSSERRDSFRAVETAEGMLGEYEERKPEKKKFRSRRILSFVLAASLFFGATFGSVGSAAAADVESYKNAGAHHAHQLVENNSRAKTDWNEEEAGRIKWSVSGGPGETEARIARVAKNKVGMPSGFSGNESKNGPNVDFFLKEGGGGFKITFSFDFNPGELSKNLRKIPSKVAKKLTNPATLFSALTSSGGDVFDLSEGNPLDLD